MNMDRQSVCVFKVLQILTTLALVSGFEKHTTSCLDGWVPFIDSCYLFGTRPLDFTTAEQYCVQHGGHLIHVQDSIENAFIKDRLRQMLQNEWWMGLVDEGVEGIWTWTDTDEIAEFTDFHTGDGGPHLIEDCAQFYRGHDFEWDDQDCSKTNYPICEMRSPGCNEQVPSAVIG